MFKILTLMTVAALVLVFNFVDTASAQYSGRGIQMLGGNAGKCPIGTCNVTGGRFAKDVNNCSTANCKQSGPKEK
jgi:hypothetical protein